MNPRKISSFYTSSQMVQLALAPDPCSSTGLRDRAILSVLCSTGLRASELCQLEGRDLHSDRLFVRQGKFGHQRWVALPPAASRAVGRYLVTFPVPKGTAPVFRSLNGRQLSRRQIHKIVTRHARSVGLRGCVHTTRHFAATMGLNHGVSLFSVKALLGHVRLATTSNEIADLLFELESQREGLCYGKLRSEEETEIWLSWWRCINPENASASSMGLRFSRCRFSSERSHRSFR